MVLSPRPEALDTLWKIMGIPKSKKQTVDNINQHDELKDINSNIVEEYSWVQEKITQRNASLFSF